GGLSFGEAAPAQPRPAHARRGPDRGGRAQGPGPRARRSFLRGGSRLRDRRPRQRAGAARSGREGDRGGQAQAAADRLRGHQVLRGAHRLHRLQGEPPLQGTPADRGEGEDRGDGPRARRRRGHRAGARAPGGGRAGDPRCAGSARAGPRRGRSALRSHRRNGGQPRHAAAAGRGRQRPFREGPGLPPANHLRNAVLAAEMLNSANAVGPFNLADVLTGVVELEREMIEAIEKDFPQIAARKGFAEYKKALEALTKVVRDRPRDADGCLGVARFLSASNQALTPVVKEKLAPSAKKDIKGEQTSWKDIVLRSKEFPDELNIDGSNFVRVDHLQLVNDESEKSHKFRIEGQKDMWKTRKSFTYPDKESVSDSGVAYIGGEAKWQVGNLKPGKDLIVIKAFDAIFA